MDSKPTKPAASKSVPNLYKILGLAEPDCEALAIEAAIERLEAKAHRLKGSNPTKAQQAIQIVKVARLRLLDPAKKLEYDLAWKRQFGDGSSRQESEATREAAARRGRLLALLPHGSPEAPFDLGEFLRSSPVEDDAREAEWNALVGALSASENVGLAASGPSSQPAPAQSRKAPVKPASGKPLAQSRLAPDLRRKRKNRLLLPVLGLLGCLVTVLGLVAFLLRDPPADAPLADKNLAGKADAPNNPPAEPPPRRSGLPQVAGFSDSDLEALQNPGAIDFGPSTLDLESVDTASEKPAPAAGNMNEPADSDATMAATPPPPSETQVSPMPPPEIAEMSDAAKQDWDAMLKSVSERLAKYQYDEALAAIMVWQDKPLPEQQQQQRKRIEAIIPLAQAGHAGLVTAIDNLSGGEVIKVGTSAEVAFIEGDATRIVIKLRGERREYPINALPAGMLTSLLDLSLDSVNARAQAQRAAFIMFQPNRNSRSLSTARELLITASQAPTVADDMPEVFDDFASVLR